MNWATEKQIWFINKLLKEKTNISKKERDNYFLQINNIQYRMSTNHKSGISYLNFDKAKVIIDGLLKNNFTTTRIGGQDDGLEN